MDARFLQGLGPVPPVLGLAVSGGGDSLAMLSLAVSTGLRCHAVTVDHGLRDGSAAEATEVARICATMGVPHDILRWHWDGQGNLMDAARRARRRMIADWAQSRGIGTVALGHTRDDVAETFLMRLARGAGLDGLAAMRATWVEGIEWRRPLLHIGREELRQHLRAKGMAWIDDPSNDNTRFDRVRARQALTALPLGLTAERLADVAAHLADARAALDSVTLTAAQNHARVIGGDIVIDPQGIPPEILRRLVLRAIAWVAPSDYGPRGEALAHAMATLAAGKGTTLHGCQLRPTRDGWRILRELGAVPAPVAALSWDCWQMEGPITPDHRIGALDEGIALCPDWRDTGMPRRSLVASPAVWLGSRLVAAPLAGFANGWAGMHLPAPDAFHSPALSH